MNTKLSAVVSAYNEEHKIADCLRSLEFADELIVIDNESTDKTAALARAHGARVIPRKNNLMLNVNKNFGFREAKNDWILNLDADERVTRELREEIENKIKEGAADGYWIPRKNIIFGKWVKGDMWWPDYQLRLFKKGKGRFPEKHVHEYLEVDGKTGKLEAPLKHLNYSSISQFLHKMDKIYTENEASLQYASGKKLKGIDAVRYPVQDFFKTYFSQKGYKDGLHGLVLSLLQAFYSLVVFAKVWEKQGFQEEKSESLFSEFFTEWKEMKKESAYWFYTVLISESKSPLQKMRYRLMRKAAGK